MKMEGSAVLLKLLIIMCAVQRNQSYQATKLAENMPKDYPERDHLGKHLSPVDLVTSNHVGQERGFTTSGHNEHDAEERTGKIEEINEIPVFTKSLSSSSSNGEYPGKVNAGQDFFLSGLGDSDQPIFISAEQEDSSRSDLPAAARNVPPYMINLYKKFARDRRAHPDANIVRSFLSADMDTDSTTSGSGSGRSWDHQQTPEGAAGDCILLFNVTLPSGETIIMAQLRIFILVANGNTHYGGIARVIVYRDWEAYTERLTSRVVYRRGNGWESFDLTNLVRLVIGRERSRASHGKPHRMQSQSLRLMVHLQGVVDADERASLDVDISHDVEFEPLLVVYSDNDANHHGQQDKALTSDRIMHRNSDLPRPRSLNSAPIVRGKRDSASRRNLCRRWPMQVIFKDIGWDRWIVAPRRYQAYKCAGKCVFPLPDYWSPTTHSIIQSLAHEYDPIRVDSPCCVPTQLGPISMLYLDENNVLTFKYRYEGMVVTKCGCH